jgi:hypothetical protein
MEVKTATTIQGIQHSGEKQTNDLQFQVSYQEVKYYPLAESYYLPILPRSSQIHTHHMC